MDLGEIGRIDRRAWVLAAARLVVTAGFSMVMPFLAIHLAIDRGVRPFTIGLVWSVAGLAGAATQWVAGEISDRIGRRKLLIAAMVARACNLALMGWCVGRTASIPTIGMLCVANSVLRSLFDPVASAMVADLTPPHLRVTAFSVQRVGINIGWAAGPAIAALAASRPYSEMFYWSVPLTVAAAFAVAAIPETAGSPARSKLTLDELLSFRGDRAFTRFLLATLAFFLLQVQLYQTLSIYAARQLGMTRAEVGAFYTLNGAMVVFLQLPLAISLGRVGARRALFAGSLGYAAAYAACAVAQGHASLMLCVVGITLSEMMTSPVQQSAATSMAPAGRIGAYAGLYGLCQVLSQSIGPLVGASILDVLPDRLAWPVLAGFGVLAAIGYRRALSAVPGAPPAPPPPSAPPVSPDIITGPS